MTFNHLMKTPVFVTLALVEPNMAHLPPMTQRTATVSAFARLFATQWSREGDVLRRPIPPESSSTARQPTVIGARSTR